MRERFALLITPPRSRQAGIDSRSSSLHLLQIMASLSLITISVDVVAIQAARAVQPVGEQCSGAHGGGQA